MLRYAPSATSDPPICAYGRVPIVGGRSGQNNPGWILEQWLVGSASLRQTPPSIGA